MTEEIKTEVKIEVAPVEIKPVETPVIQPVEIKPVVAEPVVAVVAEVKPVVEAVVAPVVIPVAEVKPIVAIPVIKPVATVAIKPEEKKKLKKVARMNLTEVQQLMKKMKTENQQGSKKYEHLQVREQELTHYSI